MKKFLRFQYEPLLARRTVKGKFQKLAGEELQHPLKSNTHIRNGNPKDKNSERKSVRSQNRMVEKNRTNLDSNRSSNGLQERKQETNGQQRSAEMEIQKRR